MVQLFNKIFGRNNNKTQEGNDQEGVIMSEAHDDNTDDLKHPYKVKVDDYGNEFFHSYIIKKFNEITLGDLKQEVYNVNPEHDKYFRCPLIDNNQLDGTLEFLNEDTILRNVSIYNDGIIKIKKGTTINGRRDEVTVTKCSTNKNAYQTLRDNAVYVKR